MILLSVLVGTLAVFSSFAEDVAEAAVEYGKTVYNMSTSKKPPSINTNNPFDSKWIKVGDYWNLTYEGADASTNNVSLLGSADEFYVFTPSETVLINSKYETVTNDDGTTETKKTDKNTDYFVIDFDLGSKSGSLIDGIVFQSHYAQNGTTKFAQSNPVLNGTDTSSFYISVEGQSACHVQPVKVPGEWINVTIVYDVSSFDEETGDAVTKDWKTWVYIDGVLCGELPPIPQTAVSLYRTRIRTLAGVANGLDSSSMFANFTYKTFERGYAGPMTESGILGSTGINLADIPDLAYTQENTPREDNKLIATIERAGVEKPIEVYQMSELDASLKAGDVVTLYRTISESFIVDYKPSEDYPDSTEYIKSIKFYDKNSKQITPGEYNAGDLVRIASPTLVDVSGDDPNTGKPIQIIKVQNKNYRNGAVTNTLAYEVLSDLTITTDSKSTALRDELDYRYILLGDYEWNVTAEINMRGDCATIDMNGYKLTATSTGSMFANGTNTRVFFRDGDLTLIPVGASFAIPRNSTTIFAFSNIGKLEFGGTGSTFFDMRGGLVYFGNIEDAYCIGYVNDDGTSSKVPPICDVKSGGDTRTRTALIMDHASFDLTRAKTMTDGYHVEGYEYADRTGAPFVMKNSSNSAASMNNFFYVINGSKIKVDSHSFVQISAGAVAGSVNDNNARLTISDSTIVAEENEAINLTHKDISADTNQFSLDIDININNSLIKSSYVIEHGAGKIAERDVDAEALDYAYNVNVNVDGGSKLAYGEALTNNRCTEPITFNFGDGTKIGNTAFEAESQAAVSYTLPDGAIITMCNKDEGCIYIITANYEDWSYRLGDLEDVGFTWNAGEVADVTRVAPDFVPDTELYTYTWNDPVDNKFTTEIKSKLSIRANLTLSDRIHFNVYVDKAKYDTVKDMPGFSFRLSNGVDITKCIVVKIDGKDYYKVQVMDIDVTSAESIILTATLEFKGAYNDTYSKTDGFSVLKYAEKVLKGNTNETEVNFIKAILNYVIEGCKYVNGEAAEGSTDLLNAYGGFGEDLEKVPEHDGTNMGTIAGAQATFSYGKAIYLGVKANAGDVITLSYTSLNGEASITKKIGSGGIIYFEIKAYDLAEEFTITKQVEDGEDQSAKISLQYYYKKLNDANNAEGKYNKALAMTKAIYNYAYYANAYKQSTMSK